MYEGGEIVFTADGGGMTFPSFILHLNVVRLLLWRRM